MRNEEAGLPADMSRPEGRGRRMICQDRGCGLMRTPGLDEVYGFRAIFAAAGILRQRAAGMMAGWDQ